MGHLDLPARRAARLACRASCDALDGRCAALLHKGALDALPALGTLAPRLRSLRSLSVKVRDPQAASWDCTSMHDHLLDAGSGGFAAALAALPNPAALTELALSRIDAEALGADPGGVERLSIALASLAGLRRLDLHLFISDVEREVTDSERGVRAAVALGLLRRLPALAEVKIKLPVFDQSYGPTAIYEDPPLDAALLPWRKLESVTLWQDASLLLVLLAQPAVAPQLTRLRALCIKFNAFNGLVDDALDLPGALLHAQWLSQLTRLELHGLWSEDAGCIFNALPPVDAPLAPSRLLLPAIQELRLSIDDVSPEHEYDTSSGARRLLPVCNPATLRSLRLDWEIGNARGEVAKYAAALTALTKLYLGYKDEWRFDEAGGGGADARAAQLAAFLARPG